MKLSDLNPYSFRNLLPKIEAQIAEEASHHLILYPEGDLVQRHLSVGSAFCRSVVSMGYLTQEQMNHAALRYRLGMSRDGGVIFWQIGHFNHIYDGKIMYYRSDCHRDHDHLPTWVMSELKAFYLADCPDIAAEHQSTHCLFGQHLLCLAERTENAEIGPVAHKFHKMLVRAYPFCDFCDFCEKKSIGYAENNPCNPLFRNIPVAVVEAEKTAVIMSEIYTDYLWLAAGGMNELTPTKLFPLRGRKIILFPDTDEEGLAYSTWYKICQESQRLLGHPIYLSPLLEQRASPSQKRRKIDILDYYFETINPLNSHHY